MNLYDFVLFILYFFFSLILNKNQTLASNHEYYQQSLFVKIDNLPSSKVIINPVCPLNKNGKCRKQLILTISQTFSVYSTLDTFASNQLLDS